MKLTIDEQIADLRKTGSNRLLPLIRPAATAIAAGLIVAGIAGGHLAFFAAAGVAGIVALAAGLPVPHILNAVRGIDSGWKLSGVVEITVHEWPNEDSTKMESCQGLIFQDNQPLWHMDFGGARYLAACCRQISGPVDLYSGRGLAGDFNRRRRCALSAPKPERVTRIYRP